MLCAAILGLACTSVMAADMSVADVEYIGFRGENTGSDIPIYLDGEELTEYTVYPVIINDRLLVNARDVFTVLGCGIEWDNDRREVTVKKEDMVIVIPIDKNEIYKNGARIAIDTPSRIINSYTMIPLRVVAESLGCNVDYTSGKVYIETPGYDGEDSKADEQDTDNKAEPARTAEHYDGPKYEGKVVLWDTISNTAANDSESKQTPVDGVDVLCPTWFEIRSDGSISNVSGKGYVDWAHSQGYEVWGLVTNSFSPDVSSEFLNNREKGDKIIDELLGYIIDLRADGINVDFESIYDEDGDAYVDFMKRLADRFHEMNLTVSVDTYMPAPYNERYHMKEMGEICDYVVLMAYDEHFSTSPQAGSVSSLPWVEKYLEISQGLMDMDKLILGCPFYTRIWVTDSDNNVVANESSGMDSALDIVKQNGAEITYDSETGQNYAQYSSGKGITKIWLEDEMSLSKRLQLSTEYGCGGCAFWRRGFESDGAWDIINEYY